MEAGSRKLPPCPPGWLAASVQGPYSRKFQKKKTWKSLGSVFRKFGVFGVMRKTREVSNRSAPPKRRECPRMPHRRAERHLARTSGLSRPDEADADFRHTEKMKRPSPSHHGPLCGEHAFGTGGLSDADTVAVAAQDHHPVAQPSIIGPNKSPRFGSGDLKNGTKEKNKRKK
jgi:hypothetical protein